MSARKAREEGGVCGGGVGPLLRAPPRDGPR